MANNNVNGVFPCYDQQFQIGATRGAETYVNIAECTTFSVAFEDNVEEWTPYGSEGWKKRLMTGKGVTITVTAKRSIGDAGNDAVAACAMANGRDAERPFQWTFPDGAKLVMPDAVISVSNNGGGESTNVGPLEFRVMSNGKPTYTPAA